MKTSPLPQGRPGRYLRITSLSTVLAVSSLLGQLAPAADGDLDPDFGMGGMVTTDFDRSTDIAYAVARQADGKLVVAGTTYRNNDYTGEDFALIRYQPDGSIDSSFGVNGRVTTDFPGLAAVISSLVIQPDGKIIAAGGAFPLFTFIGDFVLARYLPDGSLDPTFGSGGIVTTSFPGQGSYAFSVALQPDGRIVAAGTNFINFSSDDSSNTDFGLARYHPDGSPDTTFGGAGQVAIDFDGFNDDAFSVLLQPDGRIVAVGSAKNPANFYDFAAVRLLTNGAIDPSFGSAGKVRTDFGDRNFDQARAAVLQPDGKIVAAGFATSVGGLVQNFALARYGADGVLDPSFSGDGIRQIDFESCCQSAYEVLLQPDGKIVAVGYPNSESSDADFLLARVSSSGMLDPTFGVGGKVRTSFGDLNDGANGALLQPDGRIVVVGFHPTASNRFSEFALARYLNDAAGLALTSAVSRKSHGNAGPFDIALPLSGEPGVECRDRAGRHTLVFTFSSEVVSGEAELTAGVGSISGSPVFAGNTMTLQLAEVSDQQAISVTLTNVTSAEAQVLPATTVSMSLLSGDVNADRIVSGADVRLTKEEVGQSVGSANFRQDINANGAIRSGDVREVRANLGNGLP